MAKNNNINVNYKNANKYLKLKVKLKKIGLTLATISIVATSVGIGHHVYTDVKVPEAYTTQGVSVSCNQKLSFKEELTDKFVLLEANNWKGGVSDNFLHNIDLCNTHNIPCGVIITSDALNEKEAKADASVLSAIIDSYEINCPIYYNVDKIVDSLDDDKILDIYNVFSAEMNSNNENYEIRLSITEDNVNSLDNKFDDINKMIICDDKEVNYNGTFDTCSMTRTNTLYSSNKYELKSLYTGVSNEENISDPFEGLYKGIDISQYQEGIDWEIISNEDVDFVILRLTCFPKFHDGKEMKIDEQFETYVKACEKYNIPYGLYCYTKAETTEEAKKEAETVIKYLKDKNMEFDLPIYYDIEMEHHFENPKLSAELTKTFCSEIEKAGYNPALYSSYSLIKDMVEVDESIKDYEKWVAYYKYDNERGYDEVLEEHIPEISGIGKYRVVQVTQSAKLAGKTVDVNFTNLNTQNNPDKRR